MPVDDGSTLTVSVYVSIAKAADTVQAAVIAPVVYVVPDNEPPQPVTEEI
jgi:hypothetical protein